MFGALSPLARDKSVVDVFVRFHMDRGLGEKFSDAPWSASCVGKIFEWCLKDICCKLTMRDLDKRRRTDLKDILYETAERGDVFVWTVHGSTETRSC